jgi:thiamine pyrophosphate-dependent acetolactate synthase large subunit-like protein
MGQAAMMGLGLALSQPRRRVLVVTGDGEMLMGMGALATIGVQRPENLTVVVLDNGRYGETGMQPSHTSFGVDLVGIARACGFPGTFRVTRMEEIPLLRDSIHRGSGPALAVVEVSCERHPLVLPPKEGPVLKRRFREALLGS